MTIEENPFRHYFTGLNDKTLYEKLGQRKDHQPLAEQVIIEEAIARNLVANGSDKAIDEALTNYHLANPVLLKETYFESIHWDKKLYNAIAGFFLFAGLSALTQLHKDPFNFIAAAALLFYLAVYIFRIPRRRAHYVSGGSHYNRQGNKTAIKAGYGLSFLGGVGGLLAGFEFYFSGIETTEGRIYEYDYNTRRHGRVMIAVSVVMFFLWEYAMEIIQY